MQVAPTHLIRLALMLVVAAFGFMLDVNVAYAQAATCSQLNSQLRQFDRNRDFRNAAGNDQALRQLQAELQSAESAYVRTGCNAAAKAGQQLTRECLKLARTITNGRAEVEQLSQSLQTAGAVVQQREALLQELARFGCNGNSSVSVTNQQQERGTLFNQLFGGFTAEGQDGYGNGSDIQGDQFSGLGGYATVRTVCVRLTDGYFWPVSYSTMPDFVGNDAAACQAQCPGTPVELYYYNNPGEEPEQMRSVSGVPYMSLPSAFRYRSEFDTEASCTVKQTAEANISTIGAGGRQIGDYEGTAFPLPMRDPRDPPAPVALAQAPLQALTPVQAVADTGILVDIPLPRRRPGSAAPVVTQTVADPMQTARIVMFGDKRVRIVGPETPYAQAGAAGT